MSSNSKQAFVESNYKVNGQGNSTIQICPKIWFVISTKGQIKPGLVMSWVIWHGKMEWFFSIIQHEAYLFHSERHQWQCYFPTKYTNYLEKEIFCHKRKIQGKEFMSVNGIKHSKTRGSKTAVIQASCLLKGDNLSQSKLLWGKMAMERHYGIEVFDLPIIESNDFFVLWDIILLMRHLE